MILDRFFGLIAAAAFALGIAVQIHLLSNAQQFDPFDPLLLTYAALAAIAIGFITLRAERKHGLIDPYDESIDMVEVAYSLPGWARVVSFVLVSYTVLLYLAIPNKNGQAVLTPLLEISILRPGLLANGIPALIASTFLFSSFVIAIFLLVRKPIKEFH